MAHSDRFARWALILSITSALVVVAGRLLSGSTHATAQTVSSVTGSSIEAKAMPLPPCGTAQDFSGSITLSDPFHNNYLNDTRGPDVCIAPRSCTGVIMDQAGFHYDLYNFTNPNAAARQVTVQVNGSGCMTPLGVDSFAYLGSFNPADLCENWLASTGGPVTGITSYSCTIPASASFVIMVEEYSTTIGCASYGLTVTVQCVACGENTPTITPVPAKTPTPTGTATPVTTPSATPAATNTVTFTPCPMNFSDVQPSDYFYEAVRYLYCAGAISGYSDGTFRPYNNVTRGQLCKIIVLSEGWAIDTSGGPHFVDVPTTHPFYAFVETAYHHEIISGYADGSFRPGNDVTRGQLCKIVVLAQQWPIDTTGGPHFSDVPTTHSFYGYVETAYNRGIISGYSDSTFRPGNSATRGQISKIVYQAITGGVSK